MDAEFGRRVKAARGYADEMSQRELAERLSGQEGQPPVSESTVKRIERGERGVKGDDRYWSKRLAKATGVPALFLQVGWGPLEVPPDREHRVDQLADEIMERLDTMQADLEALRNPTRERRQDLSPDSEEKDK